ncbi:uncharacterized protein LOC118239197 isoform X1 [Cricetulus griseus]|uniref:uncharacterized protein LOC118239197 isoform X1 n=1 Tax=Cricetulus griseus TaxID=10029 RepID=UPI0015C3956A|nr:uncharacterized protein LOC118239197 isoform X1 [Cricetulus griseus]
MHFGGRLRALESQAGGRASQAARAAEVPEPNSGSRSRLGFHQPLQPTIQQSPGGPASDTLKILYRPSPIKLLLRIPLDHRKLALGRPKQPLERRLAARSSSSALLSPGSTHPPLSFPGTGAPGGVPPGRVCVSL